MRKLILFISFMCEFAILFTPSFARTEIDTTVTWTLKTGGAVYSSPTCDNGLVYIGSDDGTMYCLKAESGSVVWKFNTSGLIRCKPAVGDTIVYFDSDDGYLYAVNKYSGAQIWNLDIGNHITRILPDPNTSFWDYMQSSPCIDSGVVYVGSGNGCLYAVHALSGALLWKATTNDIIRSSPCVYQQNVFVGSNDGYIYAFNKTNGSLVWKYDTQLNGYKRVTNSPRVSNGIVYCGSRSGYFHALDANTGAVVWRYYYSSNYPMIESSAIIVNGLVYVGSSDLKKVFSFNATKGTIQWSCAVSGDTWSSPFYEAGILYIGLASYGDFSTQNSGALLAIDASTGTIAWRHNTGTTRFIGGVVSSPTVDHHMIFFGGIDSLVYAIPTMRTNGVPKGIETLKTFHLKDNYPNPFNPTTTIEYQVSVRSHMTLRIYDALGRELSTLVDGIQKPGDYRVTLDGRHLSSGVYIARLMSGTTCETKTLVLLK
jgi:eukaryotic-like serine/threonine-protein kinase